MLKNPAFVLRNKCYVTSYVSMWWSCKVLPSRQHFSLSHLSKKELVGAVTTIYQCTHEEQKNKDQGTCYSSKQRGLEVENNKIQAEDKVTIFRS